MLVPALLVMYLMIVARPVWRQCERGGVLIDRLPSGEGSMSRGAR
jgi:hypothetical protein